MFGIRQPHVTYMCKITVIYKLHKIKCSAITAYKNQFFYIYRPIRLSFPFWTCSLHFFLYKANTNSCNLLMFLLKKKSTWHGPVCHQNHVISLACRLQISMPISTSIYHIVTIYLSNGLFFFERCSLITATVCAYKLNNAR